MSYCIYLRKSRADMEEEARGERETLARHKKILLELSKKMNLSITKIHKEIVSGETISSRPVMQQLLNEVEQGLWEGVLVVEVERLARGDTIDQRIVAQAFKYSNTQIITPVKNYDPNDEFDEEYFEFGLFMSRREYKTINRRLQSGRLQSVKEGKYVGNIAPYGYARKKIENEKGYTLKINPDESKIVKLIYDCYTDSNRIGTCLIANKLNEMKIPTRKGGDWTTSTIRGILSNPVYIGKIRWNWRPEKKKVIDGKIVKERPRANKEDQIIVDGLHQSIVDKAIFELAQNYLNENPPTPIPTRFVIKNPLAGLIVCGVCGRRMNRRPYKDGSVSTLLCAGPTCTNVSSPLHLVEKRLLQSLETWLEDYKLNLKAREKQNNTLEKDMLEESIGKIKTYLETLNTQLNSLHDLLEQNIYSIETFLERSKVLTEKIETTNKEKIKLEQSLQKISNMKKEETTIVPKVEKIIDLYWKLETPKEKNLLLKEILDKVVYTKEEGGRWSGKIDSFELKIYPNLPR